MPLFLAELGYSYRITRISGPQKHRHYLESLGFVPGAVVIVVSKFNNYILVSLKGSRIGLSEDLSKKIIIHQEAL